MSAQHIASQTHNRRSTWGNRLIRFSAIAIMLSSIVKFLHPPKAVAYMASMGYEGGSLFFVAAMEMTIAVLCLVPATRRAGLLLISAFLGGAVAAHIATHRVFTGGPFITFMAYHPYVGAMIPALLLAIAWAGDYLNYRSAEKGPQASEPSAYARQVGQPMLQDIAAGSNSITR